MNKLRILFISFTFFYVIILLKLFYIQVLARDNYFVNNYLKTERIEPHRGGIYDRNRQPLALNQVTYLAFAEPKKINERSKFIERIDSVLHLGETTIEAKIDTDKNWIKLKDQIKKEQKDALTKLQFEALGFQEQEKRYYPEGSVSAHLLGFVGKTDDGSSTGYFGVEGFF